MINYSNDLCKMKALLYHAQFLYRYALVKDLKKAEIYFSSEN